MVEEALERASNLLFLNFMARLSAGRLRGRMASRDNTVLFSIACVRTKRLAAILRYLPDKLDSLSRLRPETDYVTRVCFVVGDVV